MDAFDPRGENEEGQSWLPDFRDINSAYYDRADAKILYVVARFSACPVVFRLAGEASMPCYLSETEEKDADFQRAGWTEIAVINSEVCYQGIGEESRQKGNLSRDLERPGFKDPKDYSDRQFLAFPMSAGEKAYLQGHIEA